MNYQRIYDEIINNAKSRGLNKKLLNGYFEKHHIVPRCLNGTNDKDNLVLLTGREHYLCHKILWKTNKENKGLFLAFHKMSLSSKEGQQRYIISSSDYELLKIEFKKFNTGIHNPMYGRTLSDTQKLAISIASSKPKSEEHKRLIGLGNKDKIVSEETKSKIKEIRKQQIMKPISEETRQKMREARRKQIMKPHNEESRAKMREAHKRRKEKYDY
jgi:DNA-binding cell septation regulator SpoVG